MPKVNAAMKGVFKEMLQDYLRTVAKEGGQSAAREGGQAAGREAAQGAVRAADEALPSVRAPFRTTEAMQRYGDEFPRQVRQQLETFDGMTPRQIMDQLNNPGVRRGQEQRIARREFSEQMAERQRSLLKRMERNNPTQFQDEARLFGVDPSHPDAIEQLAKRKSDGFVGTLNALHTPDLAAGGEDIIRRTNGMRNMGLAPVNQGIGGQWPRVKNELLDTLGGLDPDSPIRLTF